MLKVKSCGYCQMMVPKAAQRCCYCQAEFIKFRNKSILARFMSALIIGCVLGSSALIMGRVEYGVLGAIVGAVIGAFMGSVREVAIR